MNAAVRRILAAAAPAAALLARAAPARGRDADRRPLPTGPRSSPPSTRPRGSAPGAKAPTILITHGWGGNRDADGTGTSTEATGNVGAAPLRKAGFNVLTWDSRGFGQSGGTVTVDYKDNEGRDVQALIDYLAKQPEALLDGPGDPRVGMHGGSYAGGIELVAAGFEPRIDAIAPDIAWHSLLTALYKEETVKGGWSLALYGAGVPTSGSRASSPPPACRPAPGPAHHLRLRLRREHRQALRRGPGVVRLPRPVVAGERDPRPHAADPGHGRHALHARRGDHQLRDPARQRRPGEDGLVLRRPRHVPDRRAARRATSSGAVIAWMKRHLAKRRAPWTRARASSGSRTTRSGARRPTTRRPPARRWWPRAPARLLINPADAASGSPVAAGRAANAVNVAVPAPSAAVQAVGEPALTLTYTATGAAPEGYAFAQIVDETRGVVVGNQVRPIPLALDGKPHTIERAAGGDRGQPHPAVEAHACRSRAAARSTARPARPRTCRSSKARLSIPTVGAGAGSGGGGVLPGSRRCLSRRSFVIRLHEPRHGPPAGARHARDGRRQAREGLPQARPRPCPRRPAREGAGAGAREGRGRARRAARYCATRGSTGPACRRARRSARSPRRRDGAVVDERGAE